MIRRDDRQTPDRDFENMQHVEEYLAAHGITDHVPADRGRGCWPRFVAVLKPEIGAEVSRSFNGDSYPAGRIVKVSKSLRRVETDEGVVFWRRKQTGSWIENGCWFMVSGLRNERNPHF